MSPYATWRHVAMPLVRPVTVAVAVLAFAVTWGNFLDPLIFIFDERMFTVPLGLRSLAVVDRQDFPLLLAGAVVATAPILIAFLFLQRYFLTVPWRRLARPLIPEMEGKVYEAHHHCSDARALARGSSSTARRRRERGRSLAVSRQATTVSFMAFGEPEELKAYRTLVSGFDKQNKDIDVKLIEAFDRATSSPGSRRRSRAARRPTCSCSTTASTASSRRGACSSPSSRAIDSSKVFRQKDFYKQALDAFWFDGALTCQPQNISSLVVYYNKELFNQAKVAEPEGGLDVEARWSTRRRS